MDKEGMIMEGTQIRTTGLRLFNDDDHSLTEVGQWLDRDFGNYVEKIFIEYSEYSIRELSHLLILAVQTIECEFILRDRDRECELNKEAIMEKQIEVIRIGEHKTIVRHPIAEIWFYDDENILNVPSPRIKTPEEAREFAHLILKCADLWEIELNKGEIT